MKTTDYTLPAHWASALINADESGMADDEIQALDDWIDAFQPGACVDCSGTLEFTAFHDASEFVLACECLTFTFAHYEETTA